MKKFYDPPAFSWPPYSGENDSPLMALIGPHIYTKMKVEYPRDRYPDYYQLQ